MIDNVQQDVTNVCSSARPSNSADRKKMFNYLTAKLPTQFGYARRVANKLNNSGIKSVKGGLYTKNIVYQVVDKGFNDMHTESALVALIEEYYGKPIATVCPEYVSAA